MSDIIVAGSAGFVGSNLCNYLVQHTKYNMASIDNLGTVSDLKNLQASINSKYRHSFYLAEAESPKIMAKVFELEKPRMVIYNLASNHLDEIGRWRMRHSEAENTLDLWLNLAVMSGVEKFIILANPKCLYQTMTAEQNKYMFACEGATVDYAKKMQVSVLKPCNLFGPRQGMGAIVPKIFISALGADIELEELSSESQDWMYVKDLFFNILDFLNNHHESGAYYLRNAEHVSSKQIAELAQSILEESGPPRSVRNDDHKVVNKELVVHKNFEWEPQYKVLSALEHTFCWFDANRWAWR